MRGGRAEAAARRGRAAQPRPADTLRCSCPAWRRLPSLRLAPAVRAIFSSLSPSRAAGGEQQGSASPGGLRSPRAFPVTPSRWCRWCRWCHWCHWCHWCAARSGAAGRFPASSPLPAALPGFSCPAPALPTCFNLGSGRGKAGPEPEGVRVAVGLSRRRGCPERRLPNPCQRNPPPRAPLDALPAPPRAPQLPRPTQGHGHAWHPPRQCLFFVQNGENTAFPVPRRQGPGGPGTPGPVPSRWGDRGGRPRSAPMAAPPAAATSRLQIAARLFCLIKLNVSVNFPPGRAALPSPEPPCWLQMSGRPVGAAQSPWSRVAPATRVRGRGLVAGRSREGVSLAKLPPLHPQFGPAWASSVVFRQLCNGGAPSAPYGAPPSPGCAGTAGQGVLRGGGGGLRY